MPFDGYFDFSPYAPESTAWKNSPDPETYRLGYFNVGLRNLDGRVVPAAALLSAVTVRVLPWFNEPSGPSAQITNPTYFEPRVYDHSKGIIVPAGSPAAFIPATGMIEWEVADTGINGVGLSFPNGSENVWIGSNDVAKAGMVESLVWLFGGDLLVGNSSFKAETAALHKTLGGQSCSPKGTTPYFCGISSGGTSWSVSEGTSTSVSASITAAIQAEFGVTSSGVAKLLGELSLGVGYSFEGSVQGGVTGTTTTAISGGGQAGTLIAKKCCTGAATTYLVTNDWNINLGPVGIGSVSQPAFSAQNINGLLDLSCHIGTPPNLIDCGALPPPQCDLTTTSAGCIAAGAGG